MTSHPKIILGIETSCDETAAAVVQSNGTVLSDIIRSQIATHLPYGGVVPEIAARDHAKFILPIIEQALNSANVNISNVDAIAVTTQPGLVGALLVGIQIAKGIAWATDKPIVGVDHLIGHLLSVFVQRGPEMVVPTYPFIGLLVSGGHTAIYRVNGPIDCDMIELGATRDDAAGEAFDKVAKLLGLGYPGGPAIDQLAAIGNATAAKQALPKLNRLSDSLEFSFSGLKSAIMRHVQSVPSLTDQDKADIAAAFQESVVNILAKKTIRAAEQEGLTNIVLAGGVAANRGLRARMQKLCEKFHFRLFIPPFQNCTDNAAMIAYAGAKQFEAGLVDNMRLAPNPRTRLLRVTRKGGGKR